MRYLLLALILFVVTACCIVAPTPNPLHKPPLPVMVPRISPKWSDA